MRETQEICNQNNYGLASSVDSTYQLGQVVQAFGERTVHSENAIGNATPAHSRRRKCKSERTVGKILKGSSPCSQEPESK